MDNVKVLRPLIALNIEALLYIISSWQKCIPNKGYSRHWSIAKIVKFFLPITQDAKIDFGFIKNFVAELEARSVVELESNSLAKLEAYFLAAELKDYTLTKEEEKALEYYKTLKLDKFAFKDLFNKIEQGRRLKKDDQIKGNIPFVMAGVTNTGIINYINNPVASFPKNSITIDIFGNTFYRYYAYGAGDDTGVYWNDKKEYSKATMLFLSSAMKKSIEGKFSYCKKLRSSQSFDFKMELPTKNNEPDFAYMEKFISAIQKLVIKDVVLYTDRKITETNKIIDKIESGLLQNSH